MGNMIFNRRMGTSGDQDSAAKTHEASYFDETYSGTKDDGLVNESYTRYEYRVFPQHMYGGPLGFGDPNYRGLSKMEEDPLLPQRMRDISRTILCVDAVNKFSECAKREGLKMALTCRDERDAMVECQKKCFDDPHFREMVKEEYLNERSHYRQTGIKQRRYQRGTFIKRDVIKDPPLDKEGKYRPQKPSGWDEAYPDGPPSWANFRYD